MSHTDTRHGRKVRLTGCGRQGHHVEALHRGEDAYLARGWVRSTGIDGGRTVWQPVTYDGVWLDRVVGDFVAAEAVLLDATTELDD